MKVKIRTLRAVREECGFFSDCYGMRACRAAARTRMSCPAPFRRSELQLRHRRVRVSALPLALVYSREGRFPGIKRSAGVSPAIRPFCVPVVCTGKRGMDARARRRGTSGLGRPDARRAFAPPLSEGSLLRDEEPTHPTKGQYSATAQTADERNEKNRIPSEGQRPRQSGAPALEAFDRDRKFIQS